MSETVTRYTARLILLDPESRVLLVRMHNPNVGDADGNVLPEPYWVTVGGAIDEGERPEDAAMRELYEETGLGPDTTELLHPIWRTEHVLKLYGTLTTLKETFFLARTRQTDINPQGLEPSEEDSISELRWWPMKDLLTTTERIFPSSLRDEIQRLPADGPPDEIKSILP